MDEGVSTSSSSLSFRRNRQATNDKARGEAVAGARGVVAIHAGLPPSLDRLETHAALSAPLDEETGEGTASSSLPPPPPSAINNPSIFVRSSSLQQHVTSKKKTLQEQQGDYAHLIKLPPPHESDSPSFQGPKSTYRRLKLLLPRILRSIWRSFYSNFAGLIWFISLISWQIALGAIVSFLKLQAGDSIARIEKQYHENLQSEFQSMHRLFGSILGFVIAFRINMAYQHYFDAKREVYSVVTHMKDAILEVYTTLPKNHSGPVLEEKAQNPSMATENARKESPTSSEEAAEAVVMCKEGKYLLSTAREIRRLLNLLYAFIRQDIRESHYGWLPGSKLEAEPYLPQTYYWDPCRPRLWDLLTDDEVTRYAKIPTNSRADVVLGQIKSHVELYGTKTEKGIGNFATTIGRHFVAIMDAYSSMKRIRDTPLPFQMLVILSISTFIFVYSTPFLYETGIIGCYVGTQILVLSYYGLLVIGEQIENPFEFSFGGYGLPMERFGEKIHDTTFEIAKSLGGEEEKSYIPDYLRKVDK